MNSKEFGFLLLCSHFGDPQRKCLTTAQFRTLANRVSAMERPTQQRQLDQADLLQLGYDRIFADRVLKLLSQQALLEQYLREAQKAGCMPIARISETYSAVLHRRWGADAPGCLWAKGDRSLLSKPAVALVGSRQLREENLRFAQEVGAQAARQGFVLVSGNAVGADRAAQESCLHSGGQVISVVADDLRDHKEQENVLYLSEDSFDMPFSSQRALSRNRVIHGLGIVTLVAQSGLNGGTWDGTVKNLKQNISPVFCFADGSQAMQELCNLGATAVTACDLADLSALKPNTPNFIDQ